jgi:hypothetical protein
MTAVDEAEEQLEVRDEQADGHRPRDDAFTSLPHDQNDARDHQGRVDRLQASPEASEAQVALREPSRQLGDPLD